jgi:saccharopine dehydrogenase-like NADP-dependent oxidoreductase
MKDVLILGSGMVAGPIVDYLLERDITITIASFELEAAKELLAGHKNGDAFEWDANDMKPLAKMVKEHSIIVSLLPYVFHTKVAKECIKQKKHLLTASYVSRHMERLDEKAKEAGIIILNELGLDPGIDHMSAMKVIDEVRAKGGHIEEFYSFCGALVAPEVAETNPFKYKFTWSPRGILMASGNNAKYFKNGKKKYVKSEKLFFDPLKIDYPEVGILEVYPNRDSLHYLDVYSLRKAKTILRGTIRYDGWCEVLTDIKEMKLISENYIFVHKKTYAQFIAAINGIPFNGDIEQFKVELADQHDIDVDSPTMKKLEWLGLFDNETLIKVEEGIKEMYPIDIMTNLMIEKMSLGEVERDMVVMQHMYKARYQDGSSEIIRSRMLDFGTLKEQTSIARTVSLPLAIAVKLLLEKKITLTGVHIPILPELYNPILDELEEMDIKLVDEYNLPESELIKL